MRLLSKLLAVTLLAVVSGSAMAQVPGWLKLIHWISGDTDKTDVPMTMMGGHMQMSRSTPPRPGDEDRARGIVSAARQVLRRYPDTAAAERDGYKPFHETGAPGEEVHFTSLRYAAVEGKHVDYAHPGSLLFRRAPGGLEPVGVMYSAPPQASPAELDARAPRSIAHWHRHVDFCWAIGKDREGENKGRRFGYAGAIHDETTCRIEGGYWLPLAFGWMTHVYPGRTNPWGGESMDPAMAAMTH